MENLHSAKWKGGSLILPFQRFDYFTIFAPLQKAQTAVKINRSFAFKYDGCIKSNLKARAKLQPIEAETWPIHFSRAFKTWVHPIKLYLAFLTGCQSRIKLDQISAKWLKRISYKLKLSPHFLISAYSCGNTNKLANSETKCCLAKFVCSSHQLLHPFAVSCNGGAEYISHVWLKYFFPEEESISYLCALQR